MIKSILVTLLGLYSIVMLCVSIAGGLWWSWSILLDTEVEYAARATFVALINMFISGVFYLGFEHD